MSLLNKILNTLTKLKKENLGFEAFEKAAKPSITHDLWDKQLQRFVKAGKVDYTAWKKEHAQLKTYLKLLSDNPPNSQSGQMLKP